MSLSPGQKIGPYQVVERAGAGGMGEVFKAHDTRLERIVAIKVLPALYAQNPSLQARFEREARAISSLNHPNICTLYDIGNENGTDYLVLEYLEGETLTERLSRGPLTTEQLLHYGIQIADALERAHKQGLIHRDLKPSNIILTKDGAKLLDFGLSKLQVSNGVVEGVSGITRTTPLTGEGTIIGTIQYMSPEQLEGRETDARSDIFAFGAVLYEMASGQRAFQGSSQASLIAAILKEEPRPLSELQPLSPPMLDRAIRQCLAKDPDQRWQSAGDLKRTLKWIDEGGSQAGIPTPVSQKRRRQLRLSWVVAVTAIVALAALAFVHFTQKTPEVKVSRFVLQPPAGATAVYWPRVSPDGKHVAFQAEDSLGTLRIWVRPISSLEAYPLAGTEGAGRPFWSPDSRFLAFFIRNQLKKIQAQGGPAQLVCEAQGAADGCWGSSGVILFDGGLGDSIRMVPASGGIPTAATKLNRERGEQYHAWPWFLPDGKHFFYLASGDAPSRSRQGASLRVASLDGSVDKEVGRVHSRVEFLPPGHLISARDGILFVQAFDLNKLILTGEPIPVLQDVSSPAGGEQANFSVADDGTLCYRVGGGGGVSELVVIDRKGEVKERIGSPGGYRDLALSPDGTKLAYGLVDDRTSTEDIWVRDLRRGVSSRLTFEEGNEVWPIWSPDGTRIIYASNSGTSGFFQIFERLSNGLGQARQVYADPSGNAGPSCWSADGRFLVLSIARESWNIRMIEYEDSTKVTDLVATSHNDIRGQLSPDGRFLAYMSNETGQMEVYVRELSPTGGKWQVSSNSGFSPRWRGDGRELYYSNVAWDVIAVPVTTDGEHFDAGAPMKLFNRQIRSGGIQQYRWDVSSDGELFVFNVPLTASKTSELIVVLNWAEELKQ